MERQTYRVTFNTWKKGIGNKQNNLMVHITATSRKNMLKQLASKYGTLFNNDLLTIEWKACDAPLINSNVIVDDEVEAVKGRLPKQTQREYYLQYGDQETNQEVFNGRTTKGTLTHMIQKGYITEEELEQHHSLMMGDWQ